MALQMRVYAEIASVEAKVMWGMGWRQLVASALMLVLGGGEVAVFFLLLEQPDLGSYLLFVVCLPPALWGLVASQGPEAGTLSGLHDPPALRQEHPHTGESGAGQVAGETVVEGTCPPQGRGKERAWPLRARNASMAGV